MPSEPTTIVVAVVPMVLAWFYRLPRRTLRLAKEVEILAQLDPKSKAHKALSDHVDTLVTREIDGNENALQAYDFMTFVATATYAAFLVMVGQEVGGWGWLLVTLGIALGGTLAVLVVRLSTHLVAKWWKGRGHSRAD